MAQRAVVNTIQGAAFHFMTSPGSHRSWRLIVLLLNELRRKVILGTVIPRDSRALS